MQYNPIARNFYHIRRVLMSSLALRRGDLRPSARLAALVPRSERRRIWSVFRAQRLIVPPLGPSNFGCAMVVALPAGILALGLGVPLSAWGCALRAALIGAIALWMALKEGVVVDEQITLGDIALAMTTVQACQDAAYRFTRHEIFLKVRNVLVEAGNVEPGEITPEKSLRQLGFE